MTRLLGTLIAAAAGAALLLAIEPLAASATTVVALSDGELVRGARTIIHADVLDKRSAQLPGSGRIYTEYTFRLKELMKGAETAPQSVVFREWGGEVGGVRYWIPGVNGYEPGEEVVTFLGETDARTGIGFTYGLAQGKFKVDRDATSGKARLSRKLAALELVKHTTGGAGPLAPLAPPGGETPVAAPLEKERELDAFKSFIRTEVRK